MTTPDINAQTRQLAAKLARGMVTELVKGKSHVMVRVGILNVLRKSETMPTAQRHTFIVSNLAAALTEAAHFALLAHGGDDAAATAAIQARQDADFLDTHYGDPT